MNLYGTRRESLLGRRGPDTFDVGGALERWVQTGKAPGRIIASHWTESAVDRTRRSVPIHRLRHEGTGSIDAAEISAAWRTAARSKALGDQKVDSFRAVCHPNSVPPTSGNSKAMTASKGSTHTLPGA